MSKKRSRFSLFNIMKFLFLSYLDRISNLTYIIRLETQLAKESLIKIVIFSLLLIFLGLATWLSLLLLLYFILTIKVELTPIIAASSISILNIILCLFIYWYLNHLRKNLNFSATRKQLAAAKSLVGKED